MRGERAVKEESRLVAWVVVGDPKGIRFGSTMKTEIGIRRVWALKQSWPSGEWY